MEVVDLKPVGREFEVRKELRKLADQVRDDYIELAELLYETRSNQYHQQWGYASFSDFTEKELDMKPRKAKYLADICDTLKRLNIPWSEIQGIGWRKAGAISAGMNQDNAQERIEMAKDTSLRQLEEKMKAERQGREEVEEVARMALQFTEEEHSIVIAAIEEAMKEEGVNGKARAIVKICYDWYMDRR